MQELATKFNLEGYETSYTDMLLSLFHDYHQDLSLTLGAVVLFCLALILFWKRKGKRSIAAGTRGRCRISHPKKFPRVRPRRITK